MRAIVYERYGPPEVLELREVDAPVVGERDVLVRVRAASVGAGDWHMLTATWFAVRLYQGLLRPKRPILGYDVSGTVEAVGAAVTRFRPGDQVFGASDEGGAFAELMRVPESGLVRRPPGLSHAQAAAVPTSALTALQGLRDKGRIRAGQQVLVNGASGGVGTFAVQLARVFGAEVTATASTAKLDLVRSLGAAHAIDYTREDFTRGERRYDLVLDNVGNRPLADCKRTLTPTGIYVAVSGAPTRSLRVALTGGRRMVALLSKPNQPDLAFLAELLESGELTPVIDRTYPLREVPDALHRLGAGQARGKLVITVGDAG
jgi:NADPH:quinone reductase-like Zn-dependent oxidoreductase